MTVVVLQHRELLRMIAGLHPVKIVGAFVKQEQPQILPATEADLPEIARLAGVIGRAHYPGIFRRSKSNTCWRKYTR
jgi:hypothetical protein